MRVEERPDEPVLLDPLDPSTELTADLILEEVELLPEVGLDAEDGVVLLELEDLDSDDTADLILDPAEETADLTLSRVLLLELPLLELLLLLLVLREDCPWTAASRQRRMRKATILMFAARSCRSDRMLIYLWIGAYRSRHTNHTPSPCDQETGLITAQCALT